MTSEVPPYRYELYRNQLGEWKVEIYKGKEKVDELRFGMDCTRENVELETKAWVEHLRYEEKWTPVE